MNLASGCAVALAITLCSVGCKTQTPSPPPATSGRVQVEFRRQPDGSVRITVQNDTFGTIAILRHGDTDGELRVDHRGPHGDWVEPVQLIPGIKVDPMDIQDSDWVVLMEDDGASWTLTCGEDGRSTLRTGEEARVCWFPSSKIPKSIGKAITVFPKQETTMYVTVQ